MRHFFRLSLICATLFLLFLGSGQALAQSRLMEDEITKFSSTLTVHPDTSMTINEVLTFTTPSDRHGIFRTIPYLYERGATRFSARISDFSATDEAGKNIPFTRSYEGGFVTFKIGDPDSTFSGQKEYHLQYRVRNAVQPAQQPELYWDITGESWQIPVRHTTATIVTPGTVSPVECFSGAFGTNDEKCQVEQSGDTVTVTYAETVDYGDNVTVKVGIDPTVLRFPTPLEKTLQSLQDNWLLFVVPLPAVFLIIGWFRHGRDLWYQGPPHFPDRTQPAQNRPWWYSPTIPMVYEPILDITPGQIGVLLQERVTQSHIVGEIMDLARKGYLKLKAKKKDFSFHKTQKDVAKLPEHQQLLMNGLFAKSEETTLNELAGTLTTSLEAVYASLHQSLTKLGLVEQSAQKVRTKALIFAAILYSVVFTLLVTQSENGLIRSTVLAWFLFGVQSLVGFLAAWNWPRRTGEGSYRRWQIRGLQETIRRGAWREKIKEKHLFIEEVLPLAVSLGVVTQLTRDMKKLHLRPPEYASAAFSPGLSGFTLSQFSSEVSSSIAPPSSSSSSWSSGGGSSGGGGGGGGGGSW